MRHSILIALLIALGVAAWLASPFLGLDRSTGEATNGLEASSPTVAPGSGGPAAAATKEAEPSIAVRTRQSIAEPIARELVLNGRTEADRTVRLAAETSARVVELPVAKGEAVRVGDVVARLDRREREAALAEAAAALEQRTIEYEGARRLGERGFQADTQVAAARANLEFARYHLRAAEIELAHTDIAAPFDGVLEERPVELGSFVDIGDAIATLVDLDPIVVVSDVPEAAIGGVEPGSAAEIRLVDGTSRSGRVRFVARQANTQTRTFRVEVAVDNPQHAIAAGLSTTLVLRLDPVQAHAVSPGILVLDDAGALGVKAVTADGTVVFHAADIIRAEADTVWLAGIPDELALITVGQGFVTAGQQVAATDEATIQAELDDGLPVLDPKPGVTR